LESIEFLTGQMKWFIRAKTNSPKVNFCFCYYFVNTNIVTQRRITVSHDLEGAASMAATGLHPDRVPGSWRREEDPEDAPRMHPMSLDAMLPRT